MSSQCVSVRVCVCQYFRYDSLLMLSCTPDSCWLLWYDVMTTILTSQQKDNIFKKSHVTYIFNAIQASLQHGQLLRSLDKPLNIKR